MERFQQMAIGTVAQEDHILKVITQLDWKVYNIETAIDMEKLVVAE